MRIILSPAKKMRVVTDHAAPLTRPMYLDTAKQVMAWMKSKDDDTLQSLWGVSDKIAALNVERLKVMDLDHPQTPAILAYEGIAYQYMAPAVFEDGHFAYVQEHLRVLSGFYGVVRPMDAVTPYRLEMHSKAEIDGAKNLYDFWGDRIYRGVRDESGVIINLASREYAKAVEPYLTGEDTYITCIFGELAGGKVVQKGVYAKMARGDMVRFMAENAIEDPEDIKRYNRMNYRYSEEHSKPDRFVFVRDPHGAK